MNPTDIDRISGSNVGNSSFLALRLHGYVKIEPPAFDRSNPHNNNLAYNREFNMQLIDLVGYLAATLTTAAFLPQVLKVWQSKSTKDLALPTLLSFIAGVSMWLFYGLLVRSTPIIMANAVTLVLNLVILRFKLKYG